MDDKGVAGLITFRAQTVEVTRVLRPFTNSDRQNRRDFFYVPEKITTLREI